MRLTDLTTPPYSPRPASNRAQSFGRIARRHPVAPQRLVSRAIATADGRQDAADHLLTPQSIATAHAARARRFGDLIGRALRRLTDAARRFAAQWRHSRDVHATYRALSALDTRTLRDLGFDRSELHSVALDWARGFPDERRTDFNQTTRGTRP